MKLIKIKTTKGVENVSIANVSSWVASGGNYNYNTHIYKTTEDKYGFLAVCPLIQQQTQLEGDYVRYLKESGNENITAYVSEAFKKDAYEVGRKVIIDSLNELYNTDTTDYSYSYVLTTRIGLSQLPDTFTFTDTQQEPAIVSKENSSYTTESDYRSLFATAIGSEYAKTSPAPGVSMVAFYDYVVGTTVYDTVDTALVAAEEAGLAMASKQCADFKDKYYDQAAAEAEGEKLQAQVQEAEATVATAEEDAQKAQTELAEAKENLEKVKEDNAAAKEVCLSNYNECLASGEPPAACLASYNSCLANVDAEFNIPEAEANVAQKEQELSIAEQQLSAAQAALDAAKRAIENYTEAIDRIANLCGGEGGEERSSEPAIPGDAFDLLTSPGPNEMFEIWIKNQIDGKPLAADIQKAIASAIGIDGQLSFVEQDGKRYAMIKQTILNEPQVMTSAKVIKEIISASMA